LGFKWARGARLRAERELPESRKILLGLREDLPGLEDDLLGLGHDLLGSK
jgi:hypothetical protein